MDAKEIIRKLTNDVTVVENNGGTSVNIAALKTYLAELEKSATTSIEFTKLSHDSKLTEYKAQRESDLEMFRSVIQAGILALRTPILINGGAAVALLAFIGNIWTKSQSASVAGSLTSAMLFFVIGVLCGGLATAGTYFSQFCYRHRYNKTAVTFHSFTVLTAVGAYVLFGFGAYSSYAAFVKQLSP